MRVIVPILSGNLSLFFYRELEQQQNHRRFIRLHVTKDQRYCLRLLVQEQIRYCCIGFLAISKGRSRNWI